MFQASAKSIPTKAPKAPKSTKANDVKREFMGVVETKKNKITFVQALCNEVGLSIGQDIVFHESLEAISKRWVNEGSLGMGESYMEGAWVEGPDATLDYVWGKISQVSSARLKQLCAKHVGSCQLLWRRMAGPPRQSVEVAKTLAHYNVGNEFFKAWLDQRMIYTCGYWLHTQPPESIVSAPADEVRAALSEAQLAKLELVAKKCGVNPSDKVLDIGCGWGGLCDHLQTHYGAQTSGLTISPDQATLCPANMEVLLQDYREHERRNYYDCIVSVGMLEHVGFAQLGEYFSNAVAQNLKEGGTAVIHWIGGSVIGKNRHDEWIHKYIFPHGETPSLAEVLSAAEKSRLIVEDVQNFGPDYETTLLCWLRLFEDMTDEALLKTMSAAKDMSSTDLVTFRRMWRYYLAWSAVVFRTRRVQLYQVVLRKPANRRFRYDKPMGRYDAQRVALNKEQ